jgi:hypothetical protein
MIPCDGAARAATKESLSEPFVEVPTATRANRISSRETHYGLPRPPARAPPSLRRLGYPEFGANFDTAADLAVAPISSASPIASHEPRTHRDVLCCSCTSKYVGEYCQHLNPCYTGSRCQNGGSCRVRESIGGGTPSFACSCPVGFTASLCEIPIENACDSSPCLNGATCNLRSLHEYACACSTGYTGKTPRPRVR